MDLSRITYETFENRVGETFSTRSADGQGIDLKLIEATRDSGPERLDDVFALVFRGPSEVPLSQSIYDLNHDDLGSLSIFLVPIAQDSAGLSYEAVFTKLKTWGANASEDRGP